ncbi:MAG: protein BatD [Bacteroidaceae bacterium]|nr:protein BatD [Bacteroidaceae bacterium]MBQ9295257.1 protein BatD [Bacteroidaceae bacterium]
MKRIYTIFTLLFLALSPVFSQVTLKIQAPAQAEVGRQIRVSYVANTQDIEDFQVGSFEGFNVLYGPSTSRSSSFSMTNGRTTQSSTCTFTYVVVPTQEGTYKLPAATIKVDGKSVKSGTASIEVLPASQQQPQQPQTQQQGGNSRQQRQQQSAGAGGQISGNELYMTVTANRKKIYEQEAVMLTYKLYTLVNIQQISGEMPQIDGCHVQELDRAAQMSLKYERVNGRNYGTAVWKQYVLFPQKTGKLKVPSITFDTQVEVQNHSMDPFDIFFGGGSLSQMVRKQIVAPAVEIDVMPLPTPKPDNFSGAVGKFSVSATLTPDQINANDAATLRLVVTGQGNMKLMKAPTIRFPQDFEVYDPKENNKTQNTATGAKGSITYDYVVVPRHGGKFSIPPVEFCYFDPEQERYNTVKTDSFHLAVAKAKGQPVAYTREQEDLNVLSNDIRFIKLNEFESEETDDFFGTSAYWLSYLLAFVAFVAAFLWLRHQQKLNPNSWSVKGKKAGKVASRRLKQASKLMHTKDDAAFYDEVMRALLGYAGDKLSLPTNELSKENVISKLTERGVEQQVVDSFIAVLSDCEFARYAPSSDTNLAKEKIYQQASDVITQMNASIKS